MSKVPEGGSGSNWQQRNPKFLSQIGGVWVNLNFAFFIEPIPYFNYEYLKTFNEDVLQK